MVGKVRLSFFFLMAASACAFSAQRYNISFETYVGGKLEDKFFFEMSNGETQKKGFEAKMLSKRYRMTGFEHPTLRMKAKEEELDKLLEVGGRVKLDNKQSFEQANEKLSALERTLRINERKIESMQAALSPLKDHIKELEDLVALYNRNRATFAEKYALYLDKYDPPLTEADIKTRKAALYSRLRSDCDEFNVGSYCDLTILKATSSAILVDLNYAYSRPFSWFYSNENSNTNNISKFPIFETFEKLDVKNLTLFIGKPYCIQFSRPALDGMSKSMSKATEGTMLEGLASGSDMVNLNIPSNADSSLNVEGPYSDILAKFKFDGGKTVRVVIKVTKIADK